MQGGQLGALGLQFAGKQPPPNLHRSGSIKPLSQVVSYVCERCRVSVARCCRPARGCECFGSWAFPTGDAIGISHVMIEKVQLTIQAGMKVQEVTDLEVFMVLGKLGLSQGNIVVMVVTSGIMLFMIFIFLFLGMALFSEGAPSDAQSIVNSLITAGSAVAFNSNASAGGDTKLMELLHKCMEYVKKLSGQGEFTFDVNEVFTGMLTRASKHQAKRDKEVQDKRDQGGVKPEQPGKQSNDSTANEEKLEVDNLKSEATDISPDPESSSSYVESALRRSKSKKKSANKKLSSAKGSGSSVVFCHQHFSRSVDEKPIDISNVEISTTTLTGRIVRQVVEPGRQVLLTTALSHNCSYF